MVLSKEMEEELFSLPLKERARLADRLLSSLDSPPEARWFEDLDAEVHSRMEAARRGEIVTEEGSEVFGRMWKLLGP